MSTFKKTKVVMLPTNEKANALWWSGHKLYVKSPEDPTRGELNHLYFLSDEEIKEGDWIYRRKDGYETIQKATLPLNLTSVNKKIISTTDNSLEKICEYESGTWLRLPQPSTSFIEKFVEEHNKGNVITEVMVEYFQDVPVISDEEYEAIEKGEMSYKDTKAYNIDVLKVNPKDNTITIRKVKDSWNRDEVMKFGNWCRIHDSKFPNQVWTIQQLFDKWIQENL